MKHTLNFLFALIVLTACGQNFNIENNFESGKSYDFTVKRAKIDSRDPMSKELAQLTEVTAIFERQDSSLNCTWKYGESIAVGPEHLINQIDAATKELFNIYKGIEIEFSLNPTHGGIELLNYDQMKNNIKIGLLKVYKNQMTKIDSATMVLINKQIEPTYSTPELLLSSYFPEVELYFNIYSQNIIEGETVESEYSYPNPFGGDPFPVVGKTSPCR